MAAEDLDLRRVSRWGKTYAWWLLHPNMDADRFCILAALSTYADESGYCHPSQATLARHLKRSRPWVNRVIGELDAFGMIEKVARTRNGNRGTTSCQYRLVDQLLTFSEDQDLVTNATDACHEGDTPCHAHDTNQLKTKHKKFTRPLETAAAENVKLVDTEIQRKMVTIPEGWQPSAQALATARALCPDLNLDAHALMFAARSRSKGYRYDELCVDDAWLAWLAEDQLRDNPVRFIRPLEQRNRNLASHPGDGGDKRFAAWATAATKPRMRDRAPLVSVLENPWQ